MNQEDQELLRRYVREKAEDAFAELLRRHKDLIYSAALRQSNHDYDLAEEITQSVFIDLARKAPQLLGHPSIAAWLYKSTRYAAANARRNAYRRQFRDHQYYSMNPSSHVPQNEPEWNEIAPVLDEAMASLKPRDQAAILLRFFQGLPLAQVGAQLGINENAARMRVDRALDKLKRLLDRKGIAATSGLLAASLTANAVQKLPEELFPVFLEKALAAGAAPAPAGAALLSQLLQPAVLKFAGASLAALLLLTGLWWFHDRMSGEQEVSLDAVPVQTPEIPPAGALDPAAALGAGEGALPAESQLLLTVLEAETGRPVPNAQLAIRHWADERITADTLHTDFQGLCAIPFSPGTTRLEIISQIDGLADTMLEWYPDRGEIIPQEYTLHLDPAVLIGGIVVDEQGNPVADAKVGFNHEPNPEQDRSTQSHRFGFIETFTGQNGRWQIHRIAPSMLHRLYGSARHPDYVGSGIVFTRRVPSAEQQLLDKTHQFILGHAVTVHGIVLDPNGNAVAQANVLAGRYGNIDSREVSSRADGAFTLRGVKPGLSLLTVDAPPYAPQTMEVDFQESEFFEIHLDYGDSLSVRVVSETGEPVAGARVWLSSRPFAGNGSPALQVPLDGRTDEQGRFVWTNAPAAEIHFDFYAKSYMRLWGVPLMPSPEEHLITLPQALTIYGDVKDQSTGSPVSQFRIIAGSVRPRPNGSYETNWLSEERFWIKFSGGEFRHTMEEPVVAGPEKRNYIFKFEAEGYRAHMTRPVDPAEGDVQMDISLQPAEERSIVIFTPDSVPAAGAQVGLASSKDRIRLSNGKLSHKEVLAGGLPRQTDENGYFHFIPNDWADRIIVVHPDGFAELSIEAAGEMPVVFLQPWGTIQIQLQTSRPAGTKFVLLSNQFDFDGNSYSAISDGTDQLSILKVPPGRYHILEQIIIDESSAKIVSAWPVEIHPGENEVKF